MDADLAYPPEHITVLNPTQYDSILEIPIDQLGGREGGGAGRGPVISFSSGYMLENVEVRWVKRMMAARAARCVCVASAPLPSTHTSVWFCLYSTDSRLAAGKHYTVGSDHNLAPRKSKSKRETITET